MQAARLIARRAVVPIQARPYSQSGYGRPNNPDVPSSKASVEQEHPGPAPVGEGKGNGGSSAQESSSGSSSSSGGHPQPKIFNPGKPDENANAEVRQHNKEMDERYDQTPNKDDQHVKKDFWAGHGGRDREP